MPSGREFTSGSGRPEATLWVHDRRTFSSVLRRGSIGLGQSYADGWWDTDDLTNVVRVALRRTRPFRRVLDSWGSSVGRVPNAVRRLRPPTKSEDRENVSAHYDLSNDFFALMLDPTMTYSCAYFADDAVDLETAQIAKFERLADKLDLGPDDHVVEIGSGWGALAIYLAECRGCRVTTTTISEAQRTVAQERVARRGLEHRVTVLGADYRDLSGQFDALVSFEMIEAVDWRRHDDFFATCARLLAPHGRMGLQAITIADASYERAKMHDDFVRRMIFPGGCLPSVASMTRSVARRTDLRLIDLEDIGRHYPETLRRWRSNLAGQEECLARLGFDEHFRRLWDFYLCYCEAAFIERHISDVQLVLAR